jgi:hypothetical protein
MRQIEELSAEIFRSWMVTPARVPTLRAVFIFIKKELR